MPVKLSEAQFRQADQIAEDAWFADMQASLAKQFVDLDAVALAQWCSLGRTTCARLGITSQHGIYAFHILCIQANALVSSGEGYAEQHERYVRKYGSADQLPIDLLAWVRTCEA